MPYKSTLAVTTLLGLTCFHSLAAADERKVTNDSHNVAVTRVHIVFSHHLDVGLDLPLKTVANCVGFATKIVQRYFDEFIPRAIQCVVLLSYPNTS